MEGPGAGVDQRSSIHLYRCDKLFQLEDELLRAEAVAHSHGLSMSDTMVMCSRNFRTEENEQGAAVDGEKAGRKHREEAGVGVASSGMQDIQSLNSQ